MKQRPKALITDAVHPLLLEGLTAAGYNCDYFPKTTLAQVLEIIEDYQGIVINSKILVDRAFLEKASQLKFIGRLGSGLEIIDLDYAQKKGVQVHRAPDGNCDAVAEQAMGMLLAMAIKLKTGDIQVRQKIWEREAQRGWELMGKTVAILGFGYTGSAFAQRLQGFGVNILVYDKYKTNYAQSIPYVTESSLEQIFEQTDILSLHLPLTEETIQYVNIDFLNKFKKSIVLINTARGAIIPTKDLLEALDSKKVLGACLDVFENEKPNTYTDEEEKEYKNLFSRNNILCSPHVAGWTKESKERLAKILLNRILNQ
ncbi:MAG: hydroxyacid dehydrogenase [Aureispira sp.]|nr:hydroxyacid dehydrogenase [Aureispira sp.]